MQILPKHVFSIHKQVYKNIKSPSNYVDGIIINSNRNTNLPLGARCLYSRSIKKNTSIRIVLPFPILHNGNIYNKSLLIPPSYVKPIGDSALLYKHNMMYITKGINAGDIDINKILLDVDGGITTTIVMDVDLYTTHFLNKLLKLPYKYKLTRQSICGRNVRDYLPYHSNKIQVGITILNLDYCKQSFGNKSDGVGIKIKLYQSFDEDIVNIYEIFTCLYSNTYKELHFIDGIDLGLQNKNSFNRELEKVDKFIKEQKKYMEKKSKDTDTNKSFEPTSEPVSKYADIDTGNTNIFYSTDTSNYANPYGTSI